MENGRQIHNSPYAMGTVEIDLDGQKSKSAEHTERFKENENRQNLQEIKENQS